MRSHTTTAEWQSFEARMRRRRAERLALRADIAAEVGWREEAEACLEEGRRLAPLLPEFARVERRLRDGTSVPTPVASAFRRKILPAIALLLLIAATAVGFGGTRPIKPSREFAAIAKLVAADRPARVTLRPAESYRAPGFNRQSERRPSGSIAPAPRGQAADILVRSALRRYAAAFETRTSQEVSLGPCRIEVSGASARAMCSGSASWVPNIGLRSARTEPRRWDFELAKTGAGWEIVNARVQNR